MKVSCTSFFNWKVSRELKWELTPALLPASVVLSKGRARYGRVPGEPCSGACGATSFRRCDHEDTNSISSTSNTAPTLTAKKLTRDLPAHMTV